MARVLSGIAGEQALVELLQPQPFSNDFVQLVECPMSYGDYLARLREQGVLPPSP